MAEEQAKKIVKKTSSGRSVRSAKIPAVSSEKKKTVSKKRLNPESDVPVEKKKSPRKRVVPKLEKIADPVHQDAVSQPLTSEQPSEPLMAQVFEPQAEAPIVSASNSTGVPDTQILPTEPTQVSPALPPSMENAIPPTQTEVSTEPSIEPLLTADDLKLEPTETPSATISQEPLPAEEEKFPEDSMSTTHTVDQTGSTESQDPDVPQLYREVPSYDSSPMTYSFVSPFEPPPKPSVSDENQVVQDETVPETSSTPETVVGEVVEPIAPSSGEVKAVIEEEKESTLSEPVAEKSKNNIVSRFAQIFGSLLSNLKVNISRLSSQIGEHIKLRHILSLVGCFGFGIVIYLFLVFGIFGAGYQFLKNLFVPKTPPLVVVQVDEKFLKAVGIEGNYLFARNQGSQDDQVLNFFQNSFYFGSLGEMMFEGQTGIDTAGYYGTLQDIQVQTNLFIGYIEDLAVMKNLYTVDVYQMLNQTTQRDEKLQNYFDQLNFYSKRAADNITQIGAMIDDLKISYSSLSPDRTASEKDFFVALDSFAGEKSDFLLKSYTDVSQKQVALKARLDAMQAVLKYTITLKQYLDVRIKAVDQNRAALLEGIKVVDIPGGNLNIIIKPGS